MRTVFLADDEPLIVEGMQAIIDWDAYNLKVAGTAPNGLEALTKLGEQPVDLLITDIMMPQMTGLELIREVKARSPQTKFIILSGYEEFGYVREGIKLGVENYLLKPVNIEELEATIRHMQHDWEREDIRRLQMNQDWKILRNNILQRWAQETIDAKEFRERAQLLGIPTGKARYSAAVLRVVADREGEAAEAAGEGASGYAGGIPALAHHPSALAELCERAAPDTVPDSGELLCFPDHDEDLIVMLADGDAEPDGWEREALRRMKQRLAAETGAAVWCVRGAAADAHDGFAGSFKAAKQWLQDHLLSETEPEIAEAGDEAAAGEPADGSMRGPALDQFHQLLRDGDPAAIDAFLDDYFAEAGAYRPLPRAPFVNAAIALMLAAKELEPNPDYGDMFAPLARLHTLRGLRERTKTLVRDILGSLQDAEAKAEHSPHVAAALDYVKTHYREELSLKTLSQKLGLHPNYLGQLFQQEAGTSFSDYVNQYRVERATQLLLYTDKKTAEIAADVGYWDTSYFYRQFKKYAGVSPTELRAMYQK
ncbi:response regulator transcription factor [Paenibacillus methanolicus]|uniref:Two-component system response regulator YesN n=1 Tax=Paenibacillus methanolicus TaxID=582686 RepID=A0A5S5BTN1_9BACL|nr:response regulator transcription factor [Paenibacillus methanolicus]TYP69500.1 two-component system response regulator YesN [Paenibacillus methanolicus]